MADGHEWEARCGPVLVATTAVLAFVRTAGYALVWDDLLILEYVRGLMADGGLGRVLSSEFLLGPGSDPLGYYRPVVLLSFLFDDFLSRGGFGTFHVTNIALHAFNSCLVLLTLNHFLRQAPVPGVHRDAPAAALPGALIFAVHPMHVESVAFVSGRTDLLAAAFALLHLLSWLRLRSGKSSRPAVERGWCALTLAAACLSKELALLLPAVLLFWDFLEPRDGKSPARAWWRRNRSWLALWSLTLAVVFFHRLYVANVGFSGKPLGEVTSHAVPLLGHPTIVLRALLKYLRLLVFPTPSSAYYTMAELSWSWLDLAGAALFLMLCLLAAGRAHMRAGLLSLAWVAVFLSPVVGILPFQGAALAERYLYFPSYGLALVLGSLLGLSRLASPGRSQFRWALSGVVVALCLAITIRQSSVWKDEVTLFSDLSTKAPSALKVWCNLGLAYERRSMASEAAEAYAAAVRVSPWSGVAHQQHGRALMKLDRFEDAERSFREAARCSPQDADVLDNLGEASFNLGKYADAVAAFEKAVLLRPESAQFHNNLASALGAAGRWREALPHFERAIAVNPGFGKARFNLALAWLSLGNRDAALAQLEELKRVDPVLAAQLQRAF